MDRSTNVANVASQQPTVSAPPDPERLVQAHAQLSLAPGSELGRYLVLEELGRGGVGVVVAAYDPELRRRVALKVLQRSTNSERILREAQTLAQLNHPNVVSIYDVGPYASGAFIAMEYVDGTTLAAWLRAASRTRAEILDVFLDAARGLGAAHEAGIIHRDFKPSNVMIGSDGRVRVTDFGLAHSDELSMREAVDTHELLVTSSTHAGEILGTPAFMAPEQFTTDPVDHRADQFAFCVALWGALCGQRPFAGSSLFELRDAIISDQRRPPPPGAKLPSWLRRALERGLSRRAEHRFDNMRALIDALEADPRPRRRRAAILIGIGLSLGAVFGARQLWRHAAVAECRVAGELAADQLNPASLAAIDQAFTRTGLPFAGSSRVRALTAMHSWTEAWRDERTGNCVAALDGELPVEHASAREHCLDAQADRFAALVELLADADAQIVRTAISAAAQLPAPAQCLRPENLARYADTPRANPRDRALRRELARIESLLAAERNEAAQAAAQAVLADATALAEPELVHRAQLALGLAHVALDQHEPARALLSQAHFGALAVGVDAGALDAALALVTATSRLHAEYELAHRWAETAEALVVRLGLQGTALDARRLEVLGNLWYFEGAPKLAADSYGRAYELRRATLPGGHPDIASSLINLGNVAGDSGDAVLARDRYEQALELQRASLGDNHPDTARALINIGNLELSAGRYEAALEWYARAREVLAFLGPGDFEATAALQNMGAAWFYLYEHQRAFDAWTEVLAVRSEQLPRDSPEIGELLVNIASCRSALGDNAGAIEDLRRTQEIFEASFGPAHPRVAIVLHNLGAALEHADRPADAIAPLTRALEIHLLDGEDTYTVAQTRAVLANVHLRVGHVDDARALIEPALAYYAREPEVGTGEFSAVKVALELRWLDGGRDEARARALELLADPLWSTHHASVDAWLVEHGGAPTGAKM